MMNASPLAPSALSNGRFRLLWMASVGSGMGAAMHETAAVWTLTVTTDEAWMVTLFQSLLSLPLFFLALPAGALADIVDKRVLSLKVQVVGALVAAVMAVFAATGGLSPVMLLVGAVAMGCTMAFGQPSWQALMPEVIEKPMMSSAMSLGSLGINLSRAVGPFIGGYLVARHGPAPAFALNALSFGILALVLATWSRPAPALRPHAETVVSAMIAALRHVRYSRPIRRVFWRHGLLTFAAIAPVALLPLLVKNMGLPGSSFGLLMGCYGLGGILVAVLILPRLRKRFSVDQLTLGAGLVSLSATMLLPWAHTLVELACVLFPAGAAWLVGMSQLNFAGQSVFPHWIRARASAVHLLAAQGGLAIGALLWGNLTQRFGLSAALWSAALMLVVYVIVTWKLPVDRYLTVDLTPVGHDHQHDRLAVTPQPEQGPIRICVGYHIEPGDVAAFLQAIGALREARLRDGAYRWDLWQDLETPTAWWEVFLVGSWQEHLRQAERTTQLAQQIEQRVLCLHRGEQGPVVKHFLHVEPGVGDCTGGFTT